MLALGVIITLLLIYVGWRIATDPTLKARDLFRWKLSQGVEPAETQPIEPPAKPESPFTPLKDFLAEHDAHFKDETALQPPLPAPRALPHVQKRKGKVKP